MSTLALALLGSVVLGGAHFLAPALERLPERFRSSLGSFSGGVGLAYVYLYLMFELTRDGAPKIHDLVAIGPEPLETLFILLMSSVAVTYVVHGQLLRTPDTEDDHRGFALFFVVYNFLAGGGLVEEARWGAVSLAFYVTALGLHLLFNDRFLSHLCPAAHSWRWRCALATAPLAGAALAAGFGVHEGLLYGMLAVIAGGTTITVLRTELPEPQHASPAAFLAGVGSYAALILATWRF